MTRMKRTMRLVMTAIALAAVQSAAAAPISSYVSGAAQVCTVGPGGNGGACSGGVTQNDPVAVSVADSGISPLTASGSFSLADGLGHAYASSAFVPDPLFGLLVGSSQVNLNGNDYFTVTGALAGSVTLHGKLSLDGLLLASPNGSTNRRSDAGFSGSLSIIDVIDPARTVQVIFGDSVTADPAFTTSDVSKTISLSYDVPFLVEDAHRSFEFRFDFGAIATGDGLVDFAHTSAFTLDLPAGLTLTSASGVFLTEVPGPSPIPEPPQSALILLGIAVLGMQLKRKH